MLLSKTRLIGIEKKMYKWMEKRKAKSRDNHKWQKPSSEHRHIKWRHTTRWPPPYCLQQLWSLTKCFVILRYLRCFSKIIKELAHLLLFYHSEQRHLLLLLMNSFNKTEAAIFPCRLCFLGLSLSPVYTIPLLLQA